jgi:2-iminobutanoate/2-iminopropanoate deaminase
MTKRVIATDEAPAALGAYSQGIEANGFVFVSGQIPLDPKTGELARTGIEEQTHLVIRNIRAILERVGLSLSDVVKTTVFLTDMETFGAVNEVYASHFSADPPARACIQVARLPKDVGIEIEGIATRG